ncbi:DUF1819 family protein [Endozoicomonas euniceicola]|uniref:DUF1819 family protein n=1 Tax=Endozoicomonas euniceicola TaxID=1234143 RepID=A0ABY6GTQ5_9GAMM|nr:DUF1819 family protein [Endozoicomonas euniceicola]UYM15476.1 DUF1819 family protein [Endozoicomonas euniceicola]
MNAKVWFGDLMTGNLLVRESLLIAPLLLQKPDSDQWKEEVEIRNLLQKSSVHSARRVALGIRRRLEPMGEEFLQQLIGTDETTCRQLLLLAVMVKSPAICLFMDKVIRENRRIYQPQLPVSAWQLFIEEHYTVIGGLEEYSESTLIKTGTNVIRMLVDAGYLESPKTLKLQTVYLVPEVQQFIDTLINSPAPQPHWQILQSAMECTQ